MIGWKTNRSAIFALLGEEGDGKTWAVAQWVDEKDRGRKIGPLLRSSFCFPGMIALDDIELSKKMNVLLARADYVKVDFRPTDSHERRAIVRRVQGLATIPVAEKIQSDEEFDTAVGEGFRLFQGYSLGAPVLFSRRRIPPLDANDMRETRAPASGWGKEPRSQKRDLGHPCR
jgi:hypothetical protein